MSFKIQFQKVSRSFALRPGEGHAAREFTAIAGAGPGALWRLQVADRAKNAAKHVLGADGWARLRAPLLALRERV